VHHQPFFFTSPASPKRRKALEFVYVCLRPQEGAHGGCFSTPHRIIWRLATSRTSLNRPRRHRLDLSYAPAVEVATALCHRLSRSLPPTTLQGTFVIPTARPHVETRDELADAQLRSRDRTRRDGLFFSLFFFFFRRFVLLALVPWSVHTLHARISLSIAFPTTTPFDHFSCCASFCFMPVFAPPTYRPPCPVHAMR